MKKQISLYKCMALIVVSIFTSLNNLEAQSIELQLDSIFKGYTQNGSIQNAFFQVESSEPNLEIDRSYGSASNGSRIDSSIPFYTASIGKTITATAIALLAEEGNLGFDDLVASYLDNDLLNGLHIMDGEDYSQRITIAHLLSHSSGLADYFEDQPHQGNNMMEVLFEEPEKSWQPEELIEFYKERFHSISIPGESFHYSDTGYILLGLIIEKVSGQKLHEFFQKRIFNPLQMNSTFLNLRSANQMTMAGMYAGPMDVSGLKSLTADWAGGGVVSSADDLNTFLTALFEESFLRKETLDQMLQWTPESQGTYYGFGIRKWKLKELNPSLPDLSLWGHSGSNATFMYYCPELKVKLSGTFNQFEAKRESVLFMIDVLTAIQNSK